MVARCDPSASSTVSSRTWPCHGRYSSAGLSLKVKRSTSMWPCLCWQRAAGRPAPQPLIERQHDGTQIGQRDVDAVGIVRDREIGEEPDRPDNGGRPENALPAGHVGLNEI